MLVCGFGIAAEVALFSKKLMPTNPIDSELVPKIGQINSLMVI